MDKYEWNETEGEEETKVLEENVAVSKDRTTKTPATKYDRTALALHSIQG